MFESYLFRQVGSEEPARGLCIRWQLAMKMKVSLLLQSTA
jgi:hypothetical protein